MANLDPDVVSDFGKEWTHFDQSGMSARDLHASFDAYFRIFPWDALPANPTGFDVGCGSGRWAGLVAQRVFELHCIDPSIDAQNVARQNLAAHENCRFHCTDVDNLPMADASMDFGYCLGVLHHVPDTARGIASCVAKLKAGAPMLLYLYYAFDDRPAWFVGLWRVSDVVRRVLSRTPFPVKYIFSQIIAVAIYWPLSRLARVCEQMGASVDSFPLAYYRNKSFYFLRTDALDRFGTRLEKRFTRAQIEQMMGAAGLENIRFSEAPPYWTAVGRKRKT